MAKKVSAGLLMYRFNQGALEVFIVHPGGPYWKNKDEGAWSLPQGELEQGEEVFEAAKREFYEEIGMKPEGTFIPLGQVTLNSGKDVHAWAFEGDWSGLLTTQSFMKAEWPPRSGKFISFPEVDKAAFVSCNTAKKKLHPAKALFVERLEEHLKTVSA